MNILNILGLIPTGQKVIGTGQGSPAIPTPGGQQSLFLPILLQLFGGGAMKNGTPQNSLRGTIQLAYRPTDGSTVAQPAANVSSLPGEPGLEFLASGNAFRGTLLPGLQTCQYPGLTTVSAKKGANPGTEISDDTTLETPSDFAQQPSAIPVTAQGDSGLIQPKGLKKSPKILAAGTQIAPNIFPAMARSISLDPNAAIIVRNAMAGLTSPEMSIYDGMPQRQTDVIIPSRMTGTPVQQTSSNSGPFNVEDVGGIPLSSLGLAPSVSAPEMEIPGIENIGKKAAPAITVGANLTSPASPKNIQSQSSKAMIDEDGWKIAPNLTAKQEGIDNLLVPGTTSSLSRTSPSIPEIESPRATPDVNAIDVRPILTNIAPSGSANPTKLSGTALNLDDVTSIFVSHNDFPGTNVPKPILSRIGNETMLNSTTAAVGRNNERISPPKLNLARAENDPSSILDIPAKPTSKEGESAPKPAKLEGTANAVANSKIIPSPIVPVDDGTSDASALVFTGRSISSVPANHDGPKESAGENQGTATRGTTMNKSLDVHEVAKTETNTDKNPGGDKPLHSQTKLDPPVSSTSEGDSAQAGSDMPRPEVAAKTVSDKNSNSGDQTRPQAKTAAISNKLSHAEGVQSGASAPMAKAETAVPSTGDSNAVNHSVPTSQSEITMGAINQPAGLHNQHVIPVRPEISLQSPSSASSTQAGILPGNLEQSILEQVSRNLVLHLNTSSSEVRITMKPESLGEVVMKVKMEEGKVSAQIDVSNTNVKAVLEANVSQLRDMLLSRGIEVQRIDIVADGQAAFGSSSGQNKSKQGSQQRETTGVDPLAQYDSLRSLGYNTMELIM